jgi:hypothetical protein
VVEGDAKGVYEFLVDRAVGGVAVSGDRDLLNTLLAAVPQPLASA